MDHLLEKDKSTLVNITNSPFSDRNLTIQILHFSLYILNKSNQAHQQGDRVTVGRRGAEMYGKPDLKGVLDREQRQSHGRMLVTG
jgi:hypothetical protein